MIIMESARRAACNAVFAATVRPGAVPRTCQSSLKAIVGIIIAEWFVIGHGKNLCSKLRGLQRRCRSLQTPRLCMGLILNFRLSPVPPPVERAPGAPGRPGRVPARLPPRLRRHRVEAARLARRSPHWLKFKKSECAGDPSRGRRGLGQGALVTDLLLHSTIGNPSQYEVIDGEQIVRRISLYSALRDQSKPWVWSIDFAFQEGRHPTHGFEATREAAMQAFARCWFRKA